MYDSVPKNWNVLIFIGYTESDTNSYDALNCTLLVKKSQIKKDETIYILDSVLYLWLSTTFFHKSVLTG